MQMLIIAALAKRIIGLPSTVLENGRCSPISFFRWEERRGFRLPAACVLWRAGALHQSSRLRHGPRAGARGPSTVLKCILHAPTAVYSSECYARVEAPD